MRILQGSPQRDRELQIQREVGSAAESDTDLRKEKELESLVWNLAEILCQVCALC